uniref:Uncharacterized protein n=1 Tax=Ananas comosus var. bracteatus TaxID=296719 RepID=A0A6V7P4D3_ANACO|nr:unnamed protein product [Ananas comosus var. bracteatus]
MTTPLCRHRCREGHCGTATSERGVFSSVVAGAVAVDGEAPTLHYLGEFCTISFPFLAAPEPASGYFVSVAVDGEAAIVAGDLRGEAYRRAAARSASHGEALLISRREHMRMRWDIAKRGEVVRNLGAREDLVPGGREAAAEEEEKEKEKKKKKMVQNSPK